MMIRMVGDTTDIISSMVNVPTDIIIICSLSSMSLGGDKTTKSKYCFIRGCHYLNHLTDWWARYRSILTEVEEVDMSTIQTML